jgi:hypothetical protein
MADINFEVSGFKTFRQELKDAQIEMQKVIAQFGETSAQAQNAAKNVAEIKDKIDDANDAVSSFTGAGQFQAVGKAVQATAGAFAAAQGAAALFGSESEDLQKTMAKLQGALALTQGLAALEDAGRAFKQLGTVAVSAFNGIKAAIGSSGIGLLVIAISAAVVGLTKAFGDADEQEKKNQETVDSLTKSYEKLGDEINRASAENKRSTDLRIAEAERDKKSLEEIAKIREDASLEESRLVIVQIETLQGQYDKRRKLAIAAAKKEGKDVELAKQEFQDAYEKQQADLNEKLYNLDNQRKIDAIKLEVDLAAERKKKDEDAAKKRKDRAKNELDALNALNEARRKKIEAGTLDELDLAKVKYDNDLARLKEAKDKELAQEDLTEKAKKAIREKYALEADTLLIEYSKTQQDIIEKRNKELLAKEKEYQDQVKQIRDTELKTQIENTDAYFTQRETKLLESGLRERDLLKAQDQLELERLEAQLQNAKDYGESTIEIEKQIVEKKKGIKDKEISDTRARNEALLAAASELVDALSSLSKSQMSRELAAAEDNAAKQEQIKEEYFEKDKNFQYAKTTIAGIQAGMQAFAQGMEIGGPVLAGVLLAASAATTLIQLAAIANTQYVGSSSSSTSKTSDSKGKGSQYAEGGLLYGPSHNMGGIRTALGELEGGEFVINKQSTAAFLPLLQQINAMGNQGNPQMAGVGQGPSNIRAYVLAGDVTSAQEANARLNSLAKL